MINLLLLAPFLTAPTVVIQPPVENIAATVRTIPAMKIYANSGFSAPKIDGNLDDECWKTAPVVTDFIVSQPEFGKASPFRTEVKVIYDDNAIYVGAYMYDQQCDKIACPLSERDNSASSNSDLFSFGLDTYNDMLNGYRFTVTASGVQSDSRLSPGNNDMSWDAVWYSKVGIKKDGWVAELKIPYSAIRFPKKDDQTWGIQFARYIVRTNEISSWSPVNPQIDGTVNQWGKIEHLKNLNPPLRLSFIPYFTGGYQREPVSLNPKIMANRRILSGGMDINWGINESFTLNTTLIPDFGQVQSDNKILNLSPFEVQFQERRPFFTEGTELFNQKTGLGPGQLFYSRRIGGVPSLYYSLPYTIGVSEEVVSNPAVTQLYNATKFSGRTKGGLGIGVLNSISAPEYAVIKNDNDGAIRKEMTEALANYNIFVLDQSLRNNSRIGFTNTSVIRKNNWRDANVSSFNFTIKDKTNTYSYNGFANFSQIYDKRNFAKPQYGLYGDFLFSKISGNLRWDFEEYAISDKYDQNDLGILFHNNEVSSFGGLKYFDFVPKGKLTSWDAYFSLHETSLYSTGHFQDLTMNAGTDIVFSNYWYTGFFATTKPIHYYDYYEPRTQGLVFYRVPYGYINFYAGSDNRKFFYMDVNAGYAKSTIPKDPYYEATITPTLRIKDRMILSHSLNATSDLRNYGFAGYFDNGSPVIGARMVKTVTNTFTAKCFITPLMNISLRARHYWSRVNYLQYYSLSPDGNLHEQAYGSNSNESFNLWNIDFVYDWRFAPGSDLIVTWKQNITQADRIVTANYFDNAGKTFQTPQTNMISVKVVYYLDYAQMKEWSDKRKQRKQSLG